MSYWNDLWPGYDKPRGLPCCKTNEKGFPCSCAEPSPIPEGQRKADPYAKTPATAPVPTPPVAHIDAVSAYPASLGVPIKGSLNTSLNRAYGLEPYDDGVEEIYDDSLIMGRSGLYRPRPRVVEREPQKVESLCAFDFIQGAGFDAQVFRPFKPIGLMIWGASDGATLETAYIGNCTQLLVTSGRFPAKWFAMAQSFEQIFERMKDQIVPASWGTWDTVVPGVRIRVIIRDREQSVIGEPEGVQIGMWGYSVL